jgi:hypothetical protein
MHREERSWMIDAAGQALLVMHEAYMRALDI